MKQRRQEKNAPDPVDNLVENLWALAIPLLIGMAVGGLTMLALRAAGLRWTWAFLGVPITWLAWQADWQVGLGAAAAALTVALAGWHWHSEAVERGGAQARAAREAPGVTRWLWSHARAKRRRRDRVKTSVLAIGETRRVTVCRIPLGSDHGVHGVVLGATGSGKTVTQAAIAQAHVLEGRPVIAVDPKGDPYLRQVLQDAAAHTGRRFVEWSPSGPTVYSLFARGGPTEITDKALAGHTWGDDYYKLIFQRLLLMASNTMQRAGEWPPTGSTLVRYTDPDRLDDLATSVGGELADRVSAYVDGLTPRQQADLAGGRDRLAVLVEGELGPRLDPTLGAGPVLDLEQSIASNHVVLIQTEADRYPVASKLLGAALVIDLVTLTAELRGRTLQGLVLIDEFAAVCAAEVSRLFGRARDAGLSILLGTQSLADLRSARPDDPTDTLTEQLLTNVDYGVIHRQSDPASAERLAQWAGTWQSWSMTRRISGPPGLTQIGEGTRTSEREFHVHPDDFKHLPTGEAVVIKPKTTPPAEIARIWLPKELEADDVRRIA